ncbi:MAG: hypothetical protein AVDCRST_MAG25-2715 [uncultured Rubrobacteraceae bacterium]|uniref:Uncharacterized protein n=1 Tax=uncultured Rubrobacteraceae bacterium TaxID=349277 RepID=A0A6J4RRE9_9ACTN|nr:MAG: hypothetical protein AVDCRST_MAG25-2715 [uncultured Rubrobacteraceae bacterium]
MQPQEDNIAFDLQARRSGRHHADHDSPVDTRDRTIAELKSQVTLLRRELSRRDDVLMFLAGMVGPRSEGAQEMPEPSNAQPEIRHTPPPVGTREGVRRTGRRGEAEKREWPPLPEGYRVVAYASDAWVLVARGARVAGYRGTLDPEDTARDAWEHHRHNA